MEITDIIYILFKMKWKVVYMLKIRRAVEKDINRIEELLYQVHKVHSDERPDIFKEGMKKYTKEELEELIENDEKPIFVSIDKNDRIVGYVFCIYQHTKGVQSLIDRKILFIDDFCVDSDERGKNIGGQMYQFIEEEAKKNECSSVILNVWNFNGGAMRFYEKLGFSALKTVMEKKL